LCSWFAGQGEFGVKYWLLFYFLTVGVFGMELSYPEQAKLIKVLLSSSGQNVDSLSFGVLGGSEEEAKKVMEALQTVAPLKIGSKAVSLSIVREAAAGSDGIYYLLPGAEPVTGVMAFTGSRELVEKGVLVGLVLEGTVPRIYMNLNTLKSLGLQFPSNLLSMVSFIK
jgi:hypothetical protein